MTLIPLLPMPPIPIISLLSNSLIITILIITPLLSRFTFNTPNADIDFGWNTKSECFTYFRQV